MREYGSGCRGKALSQSESLLCKAALGDWLNALTSNANAADALVPPQPVRGCGFLSLSGVTSYAPFSELKRAISGAFYDILYSLHALLGHA